MYYVVCDTGELAATAIPPYASPSSATDAARGALESLMGEIDQLLVTSPALVMKIVGDSRRAPRPRRYKTMLARRAYRGDPWCWASSWCPMLLFAAVHVSHAQAANTNGAPFVRFVPSPSRPHEESMRALYKPRRVCMHWTNTTTRTRPIEDGVRFERRQAFIEVTRVSSHKRGQLGFTEPYRNGWWHLTAPSRIYLNTGHRTMDYTCPLWVTCASPGQLEIVRIPPTGACFNGCKNTIGWGLKAAPSDQFIHGFDAWCLNGWCVPASCASETLSSTGPTHRDLNRPAHEKVDPTYHHHGLRNHGFTVAISWWWHGDKTKLLLQGEGNPKVVVDFRTQDVTEEDYHGGAVAVSCPPREHDYYVFQEGHMKPCTCNSTLFRLNCKELQ